MVLTGDSGGCISHLFRSEFTRRTKNYDDRVIPGLLVDHDNRCRVGHLRVRQQVL